MNTTSNLGCHAPLKGCSAGKRALKFLKFMIVNDTHHRDLSFQIFLQIPKISDGQEPYDMSDI